MTVTAIGAVALFVQIRDFRIIANDNMGDIITMRMLATNKIDGTLNAEY